MFKKIMINKFNKIVIKVGSSSIIDEKTEQIKTKWLNSICKDIALLKEKKKKLWQQALLGVARPIFLSLPTEYFKNISILWARTTFSTCFD